jgi:hypothetical protein
LLAPGTAADVTIVDPDTIVSKLREPMHDLPDGGVRVQRDAVGMEYVIVIGEVLLEHGKVGRLIP